MVSFGTMSLYSWRSGRNCWQNTRTITPLRYTACLGGKESRKYSMCCSSPICRWELPVLRWWSSCLLFWILCFILKVVQCFYFIEQYQYVCAQWNCPKLQLQNNEKDRIFLQSLQMLQNQGKNKVVSFSFKITIHGKKILHIALLTSLCSLSTEETSLMFSQMALTSNLTLNRTFCFCRFGNNLCIGKYITGSQQVQSNKTTLQ